MIDKLRFLASGHGYVLVAVCIIAGGTALLLAHRIADSTWLQLVQWTFGSVVAGGAASAYRPK